MITSSKIVVDPVDIEKVLILVAMNKDEVEYLTSTLEVEFNIKISGIRNQRWYGIDSHQFMLKGPDIGKIVFRWPPYKMMPDSDWGYYTFTKPK